MTIVDHLARFIPGDGAAMALDEDSVMAILEALGLVIRLQKTWQPSHGLVPPVKKGRALQGTAWQDGKVLADYFAGCLQEGRARGHMWRERVPEIAARVKEPGRALLLFALAASLFDPDREALDQPYLFDAFISALGGERERILAEARQHHWQRFDYKRARGGLPLAPSADPTADPAGYRAELISRLERLTLCIPGSRTLEAGDLQQQPAHAVLLYFDDSARAASLWVIPLETISAALREAMAAVRPGLCFARRDDVASDAQWFAAARLVSALGEDLTPHYDEWFSSQDVEHGCPGVDELAALLGVLSDHHCLNFEEVTLAATRRPSGVGLNTRLVDLVVLNRAM